MTIIVEYMVAGRQLWCLRLIRQHEAEIEADRQWECHGLEALPQ